MIDTLQLYVDGSATADRWGTGVDVPSQNREESMGGLNIQLGELMDFPGKCDVAVAEALALIHGMAMARKLRVRSRAVEIVTDRTATLANMMDSTRTRATLQLAIHMLHAECLKLLDHYPEILITHKKIYGLTKKWSPDKLATQGRENGNMVWDIPYIPPVLPELSYHNVVQEVSGLITRVTICRRYVRGDAPLDWYMTKAHPRPKSEEEAEAKYLIHELSASSFAEAEEFRQRSVERKWPIHEQCQEEREYLSTLD
jgi:hypothetical protein